MAARFRFSVRLIATPDDERVRELVIPCAPPQAGREFPFLDLFLLE
jgi:hypothetical protein